MYTRLAKAKIKKSCAPANYSEKSADKAYNLTFKGGFLNDVLFFLPVNSVDHDSSE